MKETLSVKIEPKMKRKLLLIAKKESRSNADIVRNLLFEYIQKFEDKYGEIVIEE